MFFGISGCSIELLAVEFLQTESDPLLHGPEERSLGSEPVHLSKDLQLSFLVDPASFVSTCIWCYKSGALWVNFSHICLLT